MAVLMILKLLAVAVIAWIAGKLVSKLKLPSILGWLITGMIFGPHAIALVDQEILDAEGYQVFIHILETAVGLMIGTELVWKKIKRSGKAIFITTLTQSLGAFLVVTLVFGVVFYFAEVPLYLAFIFGGIALATAPAPALSIVREFRTDGPVTKTLIPMAALDDIVGCVIFFTTIAVVSGNLSSGQMPAYMFVLIIVLPLIIGIVVGVFAGLLLRKDRGTGTTLAILFPMILVAAGVGFIFNNLILPSPVLNFMLIGMAFSATFSNMISEKRLEVLMKGFNPFLGVAMIFVILNLGAPLDYHLILGAGLYTAIYILARAFGKYFGAYFGASITKSPKTVKRYLGLTLLPHSGVSLVFTGVAVSVLIGPAPECAQILQGTIAAAAIINEIIAVITAKKGFEWAGEFGKAAEQKDASKEICFDCESPAMVAVEGNDPDICRKIGKKLADKLRVPFYTFENKVADGGEQILAESEKNIISSSCVCIGDRSDVLQERDNAVKAYIGLEVPKNKEDYDLYFNTATVGAEECVELLNAAFQTRKNSDLVGSNMVFYRDIKKDDFESVALIISEAFFLKNYIHDEKILKYFTKAYLYACLSEQTFCRVAETDGNVVGLIMGQAKSDYSLKIHSKAVFACIYYRLRAALRSFGRKENLKDYKKVSRVYKEFLKGTEKNYDGILTLFALRKEYQNLGIGKNLLKQLNFYWKTKEVKRVYLFTDSTCNYGFYDHMGFKKIKEHLISISSEGKPMDLNVFFYEKILSGDKKISD